MARPSKTQQFAIYQDHHTHTAHIPPTPPPDASHEPSFDRTSDYFEEDDNEYDLEEIDETIEASNILPTDTEIDDVDRRESAISSLPESSTETDVDYSLPMHKPYTPPMIRPSFRKPDSVRSIYDRSPGRVVYHVRSRTGTPRSVKASAKGSPLARRRLHEEEQAKEFPLVLLHVTLLPVELRWSLQSMREILPPYILENLQLLRSKISETIAQRGILILHPKEEYDILEERLMEALELKTERVTKCGHFRARDSTDSSFSVHDSVRSGDSGMGSSVPDSEDEVCATCQSPTKTAPSKAGAGRNKWSIKIFAANGLMRASAWAAAWSEMERVDVEMLPWISEDLRKQLDARLAEEELERRRQEEDARIRDVMEHQAKIARAQDDLNNMRPRHEEAPVQEMFPEPRASASSLRRASAKSADKPQKFSPDFPQVYARKDVPLSLLLRNYVFLLAQDKKNIAIFVLGVLALWMTLRTTLLPATNNTMLLRADEVFASRVVPIENDVSSDVSNAPGPDAARITESNGTDELDGILVFDVPGSVPSYETISTKDTLAGVDVTSDSIAIETADGTEGNQSRMPAAVKHNSEVLHNKQNSAASFGSDGVSNIPAVALDEAANIEPASMRDGDQMGDSHAGQPAWAEVCTNDAREMCHDPSSPSVLFAQTTETRMCK